MHSQFFAFQLLWDRPILFRLERPSRGVLFGSVCLLHKGCDSLRLNFWRVWGTFIVEKFTTAFFEFFRITLEQKWIWRPPCFHFNYFWKQTLFFVNLTGKNKEFVKELLALRCSQCPSAFNNFLFYYFLLSPLSSSETASLHGSILALLDKKFAFFSHREYIKWSCLKCVASFLVVNYYSNDATA